MAIESKKQLIDFLLRRRFGSLAPPPMTTLHMASPRRANDNIVLTPANQARLELEELPMEQIKEMVSFAKQQDLEAMTAKEAAEEKALFFYQPNAEADFAYWSKMAIWTLDEAIALSLGKSPAVVDWDSVNGSGEKYVPAALTRSPFPKLYAQRRELVRRALVVNELSDPVRPEVFCSWAQGVLDAIPPELIEQIKAKGRHIADLQSLADERDQLAIRVAELRAAANSSPVTKGEKTCLDERIDTRERVTLLLIIGALLEEAKIDLTHHNKAGNAIEKVLQAKGVKLSARTIGEHLKAVREAMDRRMG